MLTPPMWAAGGSARIPARHRQPRPLRVVARHLRRAGGADRGHRGGASARCCWAARWRSLGGYFGGWVDRAISYLVDLWMSFPPVVLSLILLVGPGHRRGQGDSRGRAGGLDALLPRGARRRAGDRAAAITSLAARLLGFSHMRTMLREVLPAVVPLMITLFSIEMGIAIIVEATLSFIGLSVPAEVTTWGQMLAGRPQRHAERRVGHAGAGRLPSSSRCWAATCSAMVSASRSIPRLRLRGE